ncbi:MAG: D-aminoacyl-tRNA deacylase [Syntrophales bacterium]|nr:D-aminoacyl-tRNA deacylase [Syntrophales bacterium]
MRAVVQRVSQAKVCVGERFVSEIAEGVIVFLGIEKGDERQDADYLLDKIINLRIFEDGEGKMNLSLLDTGGQMMVISQFTLLADCRKGRRPSFFQAEDPVLAKALYEYFLTGAAAKVEKVSAGEFQAMMTITVINEGPVTILLDSRKIF